MNTKHPSCPPVLILVFNRPELAAQMIESVKQARPQKLFVAVDGPRPDRADDPPKIEETLETIRAAIDWNPDVQWLIREKNLGCKKAVSEGITWFFQQVEEGVILEDDCVPNEDFFYFCSEMLARYRHDPSIAHIGGFNCQNGIQRGDASYYYSRFFHVWGWATWRRAWDNYDVEIQDCPKVIKSKSFARQFAHYGIADYWKRRFTSVWKGKTNTWDYQWVFLNLKHQRLSIIPNANLVKNVGFGENEATHTAKVPDSIAVPKTTQRLGAITHPNKVTANDQADLFTYRNHLGKGWTQDLKASLRRLLPG